MTIKLPLVADYKDPLTPAEKSSSMRSVPGDKKVRDHCSIKYWARIICYGEPPEGFIFYCFRRFYFFLFSERGEGRKREREKSMCGCLSHTCAPIGNLATVWFSSQHSIHWATLARARRVQLNPWIPSGNLRYKSKMCRVYLLNLLRTKAKTSSLPYVGRISMYHGQRLGLESS